MGYPARVEELRSLCDEHGLRLIEVRRQDEQRRAQRSRRNPVDQQRPLAAQLLDIAGGLGDGEGHQQEGPGKRDLSAFACCLLIHG